MIRDPDLVVQIAEDWRSAPLDEADRAMLEFAETITVEPYALSEDNIQRLRDVGFDDPVIVDIILACCYRNFINRLADATGVKVDPQFRVESAMADRLEELSSPARAR